MVELTSRADEGLDFLSAGVPVVADSVALDVQVGRGAPQLRDVRVEFKAAGQERVQTELSWIDLDTPIPREEEQQAPEPGSCYALPLRILYLPDDSHRAIAEADAHRLVGNRDKYAGWAAGCLAVGLVSLAGLLTLLVRQDLAARAARRQR